MIAAILVILAVMVILVAPYLARDAGKNPPWGQLTDAPKTDEMRFPQPPKPSNGHFLIDRGAER